MLLRSIASDMQSYVVVTRCTSQPVAALSQPSAPANVPATLGVPSTAVLNAPLASTASEASSVTR